MAQRHQTMRSISASVAEGREGDFDSRGRAPLDAPVAGLLALPSSHLMVDLQHGQKIQGLHRLRRVFHAAIILARAVEKAYPFDSLLKQLTKQCVLKPMMPADAPTNLIQ